MGFIVRYVNREYERDAVTIIGYAENLEVARRMARRTELYHNRISAFFEVLYAPSGTVLDESNFTYLDPTPTPGMED